MSMSASTPTTDFPPSGCIICADPDVGHGLLCPAHQHINALAAWVDEGLIGDWHVSIGSEQLNHRTMLIQPPVGPVGSGEAGALAAPAQMGWLDQFAIIVRRFGRWVGRDEADASDRDDRGDRESDGWDPFPPW